jgi:hypothetical protein
VYSSLEVGKREGTLLAPWLTLVAKLASRIATFSIASSLLIQNDRSVLNMEVVPADGENINALRGSNNQLTFGCPVRPSAAFCITGSSAHIGALHSRLEIGEEKNVFWYLLIS